MSMMPAEFGYDADDEKLWDEATSTANEIEDVLRGRTVLANMVALGMVIAHGVALTDHKDVERSMATLRRVVECELKRQFSN